jgi:site-specific recombinase XerD
VIYGAGLRASELASLRVSDIDSDRSVIHIRQGKGKKDRYVILSPLMLASLRTYWKKCRSKKYNTSNQKKMILFFLVRKVKHSHPLALGQSTKNQRS